MADSKIRLPVVPFFQTVQICLELSSYCLFLATMVPTGLGLSSPGNLISDIRIPSFFARLHGCSQSSAESNQLHLFGRHTSGVQLGCNDVRVRLGWRVTPLAFNLRKRFQCSGAKAWSAAFT